MHPSTEALLRFFDYDHLPPRLQTVARPFCDLAHALAAPNRDEVPFPSGRLSLVLLADVTLDGPELTVALRKLLEAKDCAVRAALEGQT